MGRYRTPKESFDAIDLDTLEWIFDSLWSEIQTHYPERDDEREEDLKAGLRRKLFALACLGGINQDALRRTLLAGIVPSPACAMRRVA